MAKSDSLHVLIMSLNDREVQFVVAFAKTRRKEPQNISGLFEAMRNASGSDSETLRKEFKGFNVIRFQLKQLILQALRVLGELAHNTHLTGKPESLN